MLNATAETTDSVAATKDSVATSTSETANQVSCAGTYEGTIPGAGGDIKWNLLINPDKTYVLNTEYSKSDKDNKFEYKGEVAEKDNKLVIKLDGEDNYLSIQDNKDFLLLDAKGNKIEGDLASNYILKKTNNHYLFTIVNPLF